MNDEYLKKLYSYLGAQDSEYHKRTTYDDFKSKMGSEDYSTKVHSYIKGIDSEFRSLEDFNSKIKKKSDWGSTLGSGSLELQKPEDYTYGDSKSAYRKQGNQWLISNESTKGNYVAIKDPTGSRAKELEKNAVKKDNKFISKETKKEYQLEDNNFSEVNPEKQKALRELNAMKYAPPKPGPMGHGSMPAFSAEAIKIKEDEYNNIPSRINLEDDDKIKALNKQFGKNASLDADYETFGDYDNSSEKKNNKYRIKNNSWERWVPGATAWSPISNEGSISALNRRYGKNIEAKKAIVVKPKEIDPFLKVNSNFLAQSEESAQEMLEKNFKGMGFAFEQVGAGDYIKVTPNNGVPSQTFSFKTAKSTNGAFSSPTGMGGFNDNSKENIDQAVKLQSYLRLNASAEKEDDLSAVNRIKNKTLRGKAAYIDPNNFIENNKYYKSEDYKKSFKELTFRQKENEIYERQKEAVNLSIADGDGWLMETIHEYVFGDTPDAKATKKRLLKAKQTLYESEEYKLFLSEKEKYDEQQEEKYSKLYDELIIAKQSGNKEAIKTAKAKLYGGYSKDVIGDNLTHMTGAQYDLKHSMNDFNKRKEKLELDAKNGRLTQEQYDNGVESLSSEAQKLDIAAKNVAASQKKMNALAGIYVTEKAKSGGFLGNFTNSLLVAMDEVREPLSYIVPFLGKDLSGDEARKISLDSKIITPQQRQYYKDKGYNDEQIKNVLINNVQKNAIAANKRAIIETFGSDLTTEESKQNLGFVGQALVGVAASLPSMALSLIPVVGSVASLGGMANMSYNAIEEEMLNDPDFETTSQADRAVVAVPYALVMGALERIGLKNMTAGKAGVAGQFILSQAAKIIPKGASRETVERIINSEVKNIFAKGGIKIVRGTLAEFETGLYQAAALDYGLKALYNKLDPLDLKLTSGDSLTGGELFDTPDTKAGVAMSILEGGVAEAIGGFAMSTVMVGAQGLINGKISLYNEEDLKFFDDFSSDQEFKKLIVSKLKTEMLNGNMTKSEAQAALNDIDLVAGVFNSIDENIPEGAKLVAFNLIKEKRRLEKEVIGKDPALSKPSIDRIAEINEKLENLPRGVQVSNISERGIKIEDALKNQPKKNKTVLVDGKRINRQDAEAELEEIKTKLADIDTQKKEKTVAEAVVAESPEVTQKRVDRIAEIETTIANDDATFADTGNRPLLAEARTELQTELETLKAEKDAIQEQAAGQVPVLTEATVGEEVVQGEPTAESQVLTEEGKAEEVAPLTIEEELQLIEEEKAEAPKAPVVEAPVIEAPVIEAPVVKVKAPKRIDAPTTFSWSKVEEYDDAVIRSMKEIQYGKLKPLLALGKRTTVAQKKQIEEIKEKISIAEKILDKRANKIKTEIKKTEKGEPSDQTPRVRGIDNKGNPTEFSIVIDEKKGTVKAQLKKRGDVTPKITKIEKGLKISTDENKKRFVTTADKTKIYIDEKVTPTPKAEAKAPTPKAKTEPVAETKAEPVKKSTVKGEDIMGSIDSIKEDINETTNEIKNARKVARDKVNKIREEIIDLKESKGKEGTIMDLEADIEEIEGELENDLDGLKLDLDRHVQDLKEEVKKLEDLDAKAPENKKTLLSYLDAAITTLNGLNKLSYAKLDLGVTAGTLKLILKGIRAGVIAGKTIKVSIQEMASKYRGKHENKKITNNKFIKEIEEYLRNTFVDKKTNEQDIQETRDKFVEMREAVRKAKVAVKTESKALRANAENAIREMLKGKVKNLTAVQMKSIMLRLARFNVFSQTQYDKFIDYVDKVIGIADYDTKVTKANENRKTAKKNLPKLGDISSDLLEPLSRVLNINAKLIPKDVFESYSEIVEMLSKRDAILKLNKRADLNESLDKIIESIELNEQRVSDLKELYDSFADKVVKNGVVNYAETLDKMLEDGVIDKTEHELMKTFKSKIQGAKVKEKMTEQEIADEKVELIDEINNTTIILDEIVGDEFRLERDLVKRLQIILKQTDFQNLNNKELKDLLRIIDNINNGFVSNATQQMVEKLNFIEKSVSLEAAIPKTVAGIFKKIRQYITEFTSRDKFGVNIAPLFNIDEQFGDFKTKSIFNAIFEQSAVAQQIYQSEITGIQGELTQVEKAISNIFKNNGNKVVLSKFKMMVYMMQLEYNSNINNPLVKGQVHQAMDTLNATIKFAKQNSKKSGYKAADIKQMEFIKEQFAKDGEIDIDKLYNSFNEAEKNALKKLQDINNRMTKKATYTASVINGKKIKPIKNYVFYNTISASDRLSTAELINNMSNNMNPTTTSKNLEERDEKVHPVNLNAFFAVDQSARSVLINYHMTEPIRTARKTLSKAMKLLEDNNATTDQYEILNTIGEAYDTATKDLLQSNFTQSNEVMNWLQKTGYRAMLASAPRAISELTSNVSFVMINNPRDIAVGMSEYWDLSTSEDAKDILTILGSKVTSRNYPLDKLSSGLVDLSAVTSKLSKNRNIRSREVNGVLQFYDNILGKWVNGVEAIADNLISQPDKIVMKPLWFGSFARSFQKETGVAPDFDKIKANNEEYMDKYRDALVKAKNNADTQTISAGSSTNAYMGILQNVVREGDSSTKQIAKNFNKFMNKFTVQEYYTARKGVNALVGNGDITKAQGAQILAAVTARMTLYVTATKLLSELMLSAFGYGNDDEDDEDKKTILQRLYQGVVSSATTLLIGRSFGNIIRVIENALIEKANEEYGEKIGLRNGEYDPYEDAVQFNQFQKGKIDEPTDLVKIIAGPYAPLIGVGELGFKLLGPEPKTKRAKITRAKEWYRAGMETLGLLGAVPFYRDVKKIALAEVYKELKKETKEKAVKKEAEAKTDAEEIVQKTSILKQMMNSGAYTREGIKKELRKIKDPEYRKAFNDKEEAIKKKILDKYGYENLEDFKRNDEDNYEIEFGDDSPYRIKRAESAKIANELEKRLNALEDGEEYYPTDGAAIVVPKKKVNKYNRYKSVQNNNLPDFYSKSYKKY